MRDASQGFFDVAVNFEDIFCSAKVDTCDTNNQPLRLLFGDDQTRDPTGVAALACTSGVGGATLLQFSEVTVTCTGGDVFVLDLLGAAGNRESTSNTSARTLQYALYRGAEALTCDGPNCGKVYSNLAVNLAQLASVGGTCTLAFSATATDGTGFTAGLPTATSFGYPYIDVDAVLTSAGAPTCIRHAVNDGTGVIETTYYGDLQGLDAPPPMCTRYDGAAASATGADCDEEAPQPLGLCAGIPLGDGQVEVHIASTGSGTACTDEAPCGYVQGHTRAHSLVGPYVVIHDDVGPQQFDVEPTQWTLSQGAVLCGREGADRPLMSHIGVTLAKGATVANLTVARNSGDSAAFGGSGDLEGVEIRQVTIRNAQRGIYFYNAEGTVVVDDLHLRADDPYQFQVGIESTLSKQTMTLLLSNLDFEEVLYTGLDVYPFAGSNQKLRLSGLNRMVAALDFGGNGYLLQLVNLRGGQAGSRIDAEISGLAPVNAASGISLGQGDGVTTYAHIHDNDLRTLRGYGLTAIKSSSAGSFHVTAENNLLRATGFLESFEGETFESQANAMTFLATSAGAQLCAEVTDNTVEAVVEDGVVPFGLSAFGNAAAALRIVNRDTLSTDNGGMTVNLSGTVAAGGPACELPVIP